MTIFSANQVGNRGVCDSVSTSPIQGRFHIPWSDRQRAHSERDSNPDQAISESPDIDVSVGWSS